MNEVITGYALSRLNDINSGYELFQSFCSMLISQYIDHSFLLSTGSDAGGDGGIDGWSLHENGKIKYAFSIDKKSKGKIKSEIQKTDIAKYNEMRFFTNQPIRQKTKEDIDKENSDINIMVRDDENLIEYIDPQNRNIKIIIYDLENLIEFIIRHQDLGQYIDLPKTLKNISIDYLNKHNQFQESKEIISQYIPRTIIYNDLNKWQEDSLLQYCSNMPQFVILQAPAGYGKTCALKQLHQKILKKEVDIILPPVFIPLASYIPSKLFETIKQGMSESGDYQCNDFLLILDGYDEVKESDRGILIKEIAQLLFTNESFARKAIISVREHTFNESDFNRFEDKKNISLAKLTVENIKLLFSKASIPAEHEDKFFYNTFFQEFSDNIFYVVKFIEYFETKKSIAGNVTELFDFIIEQEITRLFRENKPDENMLESTALYMTLNQKYDIADKVIGQKFSLIFPMIPFQFSHNSIQEYLAAKKIAKQSKEVIKKILTKGNLIIPYLTNTLGFVLNILALSDRQDDFKDLIDYFLSVSGNAKRLLQIESDKISSSMNHEIFKTAIEQESVSGSSWDMPNSLVPFGIHEKSRKENLQYLIDSIISFKNTNKFHYHTLVLQQIAIHYLDSIDDCFQNQLIQFLIELLAPETTERNAKFIESLLYSIAHFPSVKNAAIQEIKNIVERLLSLDSESIANNICQLLLTSKKNIDSDIYFQILNHIISRLEVENRHGAYTVGHQITDDTYHEPMRFTYFDSFIPLTRKVLEENSSFVWNIICYIFKNSSRIRNNDMPSYRLNDFWGILYEFITIELEKTEIDVDKENIVIDIIVDEIDGYHNKSELWEIIKQFLAKIDILKITKQIIIKVEYDFSCYELLNDFIETIIITENDFDRFNQEYFLEDNKRLKKFFTDFCYKIGEDNPLYSYVFLNIPEELANSIFSSRIENKKLFEKYEQEKQRENQPDAYRIVFNHTEIMHEIYSILEIMGEEEITKDQFWELFHQEKFAEKNQFAIFVFQKIYWDGYESIQKEDLLKYLGKDEWNINFMDFLIQYMDRNKIHFDDFLQAEREQCVEWAKKILDNYPLNTIESRLCNVHVTLSYFLRFSKFLLNNSDFMNSYANRMMGLVFSAFPKVISRFGGFIVNYDSYSLEYLDVYLGAENITNFICDNFSHAFSSDTKMISIFGYIKNHIDKILPYQKAEIRENITKYIENNLNESYRYDIIDGASAIGFSITDLNIEKLSQAIILNDKKDDLAHNYACCFIFYNHHEKSEVEIQHLSKALYLAFINCSDDFLKKTIAEYYIAYNNYAGDIFVFYANYLMEDDKHSMLEQLAGRGRSTALKTADINHLKIVEKLFLYSQAKKEKSERRDGILGIALSSYKAMADSVKSASEFEKIISSMKSLAGQENDFVYRQIQEIENSFAERTYQPLSIEEILKLN